jgi:putative endonuclease
LGIGGDLPIVQQHKHHAVEGFTDNYNCERLVYFEQYGDVLRAIAREKQVKKWSRAKKIWLIERENPTWIDPAGRVGKTDGLDKVEADVAKAGIWAARGKCRFLDSDAASAKSRRL